VAADVGVGAVTDEALTEALSSMATELEVPGVAVGVFADGQERYAFHGVTSVENPLPVDETTLFQFGSTGKTFTATAMMRLVEAGDVDLDAPVRTYVPELTLKDADVAERVRVRDLLNHTAGWTGDRLDETGDGDDALAKYVALMADFDQVTPLGATVSYNNASLSLAGRIIEKVTGKTFEEAISELLLKPLGLTHSFYFPDDIMTRRFVVGHHRHEDGRITIARPWAIPRGSNPAGGMSATAEDQLRWARFHLGDGTASDGTRVLSAETVALMQRPTVQMPGSALGDAVGISWLLRSVAGTEIVGHGGTTNGQHSNFTMVPSRGFGFISMTNCGPNGPELNQKLLKWALQHYLGMVEEEATPIGLSDELLAAYLGQYETVAAVITVTTEATHPGRLVARVAVKPEMASVLREAGQDPDEEQPPFVVAFLAGDGDRFIVPDGPAKGMKGYFARGDDGLVNGVHLGGRLATRSAASASVSAS